MAIEKCGSYAAYRRAERAKKGAKTAGPRTEQVAAAALRREQRETAQRVARAIRESTREARAKAARQRSAVRAAERFRRLYRSDQAFRLKQRERTTITRFTHPERILKFDQGSRWALCAERHDGSVTLAVVRALLDAASCHYCNVGLTPESRSIDHVRPLSRGGMHTAENLVACCKRCNRLKGSRTTLTPSVERDHNATGIPVHGAPQLTG